MMINTDYSKIAKTYNKRYISNYLVNIEDAIKRLVATNNYKNILEVGCGTGRWIKSFENSKQNLFGLDYSLEMLKIPLVDNPRLNIVNGNAVDIPFKNNFFDFIFCVNAIHHFPDKEKFISECGRTLSPNGMIAVFGVDPHVDSDWYTYKYFESVYKNDLRRFLSLASLKSLLVQQGFIDIDTTKVEEIYDERIGSDVFNDPFINKNHCSQLANLSDEEYEKGITKIKKAIDQNPKIMFLTSVTFYLTYAKKK